MSIDLVSDGSAVWRLNHHVVRAVHHRGLFAVLRVAVRAWWNRPRIPDDLSPRLRADMGLPPAPPSMFWPGPDASWPAPLPVWRP